jgi:hypothetical protein
MVPALVHLLSPEISDATGPRPHASEPPRRPVNISWTCDMVDPPLAFEITTARADEDA